MRAWFVVCVCVWWVYVCACTCVCLCACMFVYVCAVYACTFVVGGCVHGAWCVYVCYAGLRVMCHVHKCMHARMCGLCVRVCVHGVCGRVCVCTCCTCVYVCMPAHVCVHICACVCACVVRGREGHGSGSLARAPSFAISSSSGCVGPASPPPPATPRWVAGGGLHGGHTRSPLDSPSHFSPCLARPQSRVPQCSQKVGLL